MFYMADGGGSGATTAELGLTQKDLGVTLPPVDKGGDKPPKLPKSPSLVTPSPTIESKPKTPQFIKEFSREQSQTERDELARNIMGKRKEYFQQKRSATEQQTQIQAETAQREVNLVEQAKRLQELKDNIDKLSGSRFSRLWNYTKLRGLNGDAQTAEEAYKLLRQQQDTQLAQEQEISAQLVEKQTMTELESGRKSIQGFYEGEKQKWAETPYKKEDIQKYFTEEHLSSLSMEDYILLLKRFPSEMVTHVTRQGIRDHTGHGEHTAGVGEYSDGFMKILQDKRLNSALGIYLAEGLTDEAMAKCLELGGAIQTKKDAQQMLNQFLAIGAGQLQGGWGTYADRTAVHVATEEVADGYYGSESGNEIFFTFPAAHIASEYYFIGSLSEGSPDYHNDQWIWARDNQGILLDAGLVFIPADAKVDPKNGSRYKLDENGRPIVNQEDLARILNVVNMEDLDQFSEQINSLYFEANRGIESREVSDGMGHMSWVYKDKETGKKIENRDKWLKENPKLQLQIQPLQQRLVNEFGITDPRLLASLLKPGPIADLVLFKDTTVSVDKKAKYEEIANKILTRNGNLYLEAENTITSREFWENYFKEHPETQPKRVIYYEGGNPTEALKRWRESQGITKKAETNDLGFPEHYANEETPEITEGMDLFKSKAEEVIEKYFSSKAQQASVTV